MHTKYFHWNPPQYMDVGINSWEQLPHTYRNFSSYWLLFTVRLGRFGCALVKLACFSSLMAAKVTALHSISILFVSLQTYCMYISPLSWLTIIFIILSCSTGIEIRSLQCSTVHKVPCGHTGESRQLATVASFRCLDIILYNNETHSLQGDWFDCRNMVARPKWYVLTSCLLVPL